MKIIRGTRKKKVTRGRYGDGSIYKNGRLFWYKIPTPDGPVIGSCKTDDYDAALKILQQERNKIRALEPADKAQLTTVNELLDLYVTNLEKRKGSEDSTAITRRVIEAHVRPHFGPRLAASLIPQDLKEYRGLKTRAGLSDTSVNRHFAYLRRSFVLGHQEGIVLSVPAFTFTKEDNRRTGVLNAEDYPRLLAALPDCLKPLLIFGYHLGIRSGELKKYRWEMIDWTKGILRVPAKIRKNREDGVVPLLAGGGVLDCIVQLKTIRDTLYPNCPWVFFWHGEVTMRRAYPGTQIRDFRRAWEKAAESVGLPNLHFHDLRRTAVTNMIEEYGFSPEEARQISGHKTNSMVDRYRIGTERSVLRVAAKLSERLSGAGERG